MDLRQALSKCRYSNSNNDRQLKIAANKHRIYLYRWNLWNYEKHLWNCNRISAGVYDRTELENNVG